MLRAVGTARRIGCALVLGGTFAPLRSRPRGQGNSSLDEVRASICGTDVSTRQTTRTRQTACRRFMPKPALGREPLAERRTRSRAVNPTWPSRSSSARNRSAGKLPGLSVTAAVSDRHGGSSNRKSDVSCRSGLPVPGDQTTARSVRRRETGTEQVMSASPPPRTCRWPLGSI